MLRAFWTWSPVSAGSFRAFDEPRMYENNKWFFDKSVWQKMFRTMNECGLDKIVLANTNPFPFMIDLGQYSDAKVIDDASLVEYAEMHHWIFETALAYDIGSYVAFDSIYLPAPMCSARGIAPQDMSKPADLSLEFAHFCTRRLLETYPEIVGIFAGAGNIAERKEEFLQQAIIDALDAARPDAKIYLRAWTDDPDSAIDKIQRRAGRSIKYSVKYTGDYVVDPNPDSFFNKWMDSAGPENVAAEVRAVNFEPWTSFSDDTIGGILSNLADASCDGFSVYPLSLTDWPRTSDTMFKFQWQRDLVWYYSWGGSDIEQLKRQGQPKWISRNSRLIPGLEAGSRILELLALYFAPNGGGLYRPQFCSMQEDISSAPHLFSIEDMLDPSIGGKWWQEVTGDPSINLAQYLGAGTPEDVYGPDEFIEEITDLAAQAIAGGEKGLRNASGEKEVPGFSRDIFCAGKLGDFTVERIRAALAHARGEHAESLKHLEKALDLYREICETDSVHRMPFRILTDSGSMEISFTSIIKALESEQADVVNGEFKRGTEYLI